MFPLMFFYFLLFQIAKVRGWICENNQSLRNGIPASLPWLNESRITNSIFSTKVYSIPVEKRNWNCVVREIPIVDAPANGSFGRRQNKWNQPPSFPTNGGCLVRDDAFVSNHLPEMSVLETRHAAFTEQFYTISFTWLKEQPYKSRF